MEIQATRPEDLPILRELYDGARAFMIARGNPTQWAPGHPTEETIRRDMAEGGHFVCLEGGEIVGAFAFLLGDDPTYQNIEGAWHWDGVPYGTIHRLASSGKVPGVARACFDFCAGRMDHLRVDTHADNRPMQDAIRRYGFLECGIIYASDGTPRIAFDKRIG